MERRQRHQPERACQAPTFSFASDINNAGQVVGFSVVGGVEIATEWSGDGTVIELGPGAASSINDTGQITF
jgi:hypothetical protein